MSYGSERKGERNDEACETQNTEPSTYELDLSDPFDRVLSRMAAVNKLKRKDYTGNKGYLANFIDSAEQLGLTAGHSVETLIATKQSRLKTLLPQYWDDTAEFMPSNESIDDTLLDRAVYSVLAQCIWNEGRYSK